MPNLLLREIAEQVNGERSPLLAFRWAIEAFPDIPDADTIPTWYCETLNLPFPQIQEKAKNIAATNIFLAGMSQMQSFDMELYEDESGSTLRYMTAWQAQIQDPSTGGYYPASNYKKTLRANLYSTKNSSSATASPIPVLHVDLYGAFPLGIQNWALDYNSNERIKNNLNFACDMAIPRLA